MSKGETEMVKYQHMHDSNKKMQHFVKDIFCFKQNRRVTRYFYLCVS